MKTHIIDVKQVDFSAALVVSTLSTIGASYHSALSVPIFHTDSVFLRPSRLPVCQRRTYLLNWSLLPLFHITCCMNYIIICPLIYAPTVPMLTKFVQIYIPNFHLGQDMAAWEADHFPLVTCAWLLFKINNIHVLSWPNLELNQIGNTNMEPTCFFHFIVEVLLCIWSKTCCYVLCLNTTLLVELHAFGRTQSILHGFFWLDLW